MMGLVCNDYIRCVQQQFLNVGVDVLEELREHHIAYDQNTALTACPLSNLDQTLR
jgi:adenosine deaminase